MAQQQTLLMLVLLAACCSYGGFFVLLLWPQGGTTNYELSLKSTPVTTISSPCNLLQIFGPLSMFCQVMRNKIHGIVPVREVSVTREIRDETMEHINDSTESVEDRISKEEETLTKNVDATQQEQQEQEQTQEQQQKQEKADKTDSFHKKKLDERIQMGKKLLSRGDALGALAACSPASETSSSSTTDNLDALICVGEAHLVLYWDAVTMMTNNDDDATQFSNMWSTVEERLFAARSKLERVVELDPTNARSRANLGLILLLLATSSRQAATPPDQTEESSKKRANQFPDEQQLILDAVMHFITASSMVSVGSPNGNAETSFASMKKDDKDSLSGMDFQMLAFAGWYNAAVCHVHLGQYDHAIRWLERAVKSLSSSSNPNKERSLSALNALGGLLIQRKMYEDAIEMLQVTMERYCPQRRKKKKSRLQRGFSWSKQGGGLFGDTWYGHHDVSFRGYRICSVVANNLGVALELAAAAMAIEMEEEQGNGAAAALEDELYKEAMDSYDAAVLWDSGNQEAFWNKKELVNALQKQTQGTKALPEAVTQHLSQDNEESTESEKEGNEENKVSGQASAASNCEGDFSEDEVEKDEEAPEMTKTRPETCNEPQDKGKPAVNPSPSGSDAALGEETGINNITLPVPADEENNQAPAEPKVEAQDATDANGSKKESSAKNGQTKDSPSVSLPSGATISSFDTAKGSEDDTPLSKHNVALEALWHAVAKHPEQSKLWVALSRVHALAGNVTGAVEAAATALHLASQKEEVQAATSALEAALGTKEEDESNGDGIKTKTAASRAYVSSVKASTIGTTESDAQVESTKSALELSALRLTIENQGLKLQLLEQSLHGKSVASTMTQLAEKENGSSVNNRSGGKRAEKVATGSLREKDAEGDTIRDKTHVNSVGVATDVVDSTSPSRNEQHDEKKVMSEDAQKIQGGTKKSTEMLPEKKQSESLNNGVSEATGLEVGDEVEVPHAVTTSNFKKTGLSDGEQDQSEDTEVSNTNKNEKGGNQTRPIHETIVGQNHTHHADKEEMQQVQSVPTLFSPILREPEELPAVAKSYMKLADAYLDKGKYQLASKQFMQVIKKSPNYVPALIGYATSIERLKNPKRLGEVATAYANATRAAVSQGKGGNGNVTNSSLPLCPPSCGKGEGGIGEAAWRRAFAAVDQMKRSPISRVKDGERIDLLRMLSECAHTYVLASEIYFEIGKELAAGIVAEPQKIGEAKEALEAANSFAIQHGNEKNGKENVHGKSLVELGSILLNHENNATGAIKIILSSLQDEAMWHSEEDAVKAMWILGTAHMANGSADEAVRAYNLALGLPVAAATKEVHYNMAVVLKENGGSDELIHKHLSNALTLGKKLTPEAKIIFGESLVTDLEGQVNRVKPKGGIPRGMDSTPNRDTYKSATGDLGGVNNIGKPVKPTIKP